MEFFFRNIKKKCNPCLKAEDFKRMIQEITNEKEKEKDCKRWLSFQKLVPSLSFQLSN
jgi:hypothetical protein